MVRVGQFINLPTLVRSYDCDPALLLESAGFRADEFDEPDHWVSYRRTAGLLKSCARETGCEHFGALVGQMSQPSHLGLPGFLVRTASTIQQALESLVENISLHDGGADVSLRYGSRFTSIRYSIYAKGVSGIEEVSDTAAMIICRIMLFLCGSNWTPVAVRLERREPRNRNPYRRLFRSPIYFNSVETEVTFSNQCMQKKPPTPDELLFRHLQREASVVQDLQRGELIANLPMIIHRCVLNGQFTTRDVAQVIGLQKRTLQRRLKVSNTTFRQELETVRRNLGEQLLKHTDMEVSDMAGKLGYADASSFIRAFERWNGVSPGRWRKEVVLDYS